MLWTHSSDSLGDGIPETRQRWSGVVIFFEVQLAKFRLVSQNPGESVHAYNVRWNLERDLVDELVIADVYPAGSVHVEELENLNIRSLAGSLSSLLVPSVPDYLTCARSGELYARLHLAEHGLWTQMVVRQ